MERLHSRGIAALQFDLLTPRESLDQRQRYDIDLLARRLADAAGWSLSLPLPPNLPLGFLGGSTGASAALKVAADWGPRVRAVVSRSGLPDLLPPQVLDRVAAPTLLIVGDQDRRAMRSNTNAMKRLGTACRLSAIPGAGHFFTESGALEEVARQSTMWFEKHFTNRRATVRP